MDCVILVKKDLVQIVSKYTIPYIFKNILFDRIYVVSANENLQVLQKKHTGPKIVYLDEDSVLDGLTFRNIRSYFHHRTGRDNRVGWYFQQFIKLGISFMPTISDHYLVWDADCIPLRHMSFTNEDGKVLLSTTHECHAPYFRIMNKLLGITRNVHFSFISEHMLFNKQIVDNMIRKLSAVAENQDWWITILDAVEDDSINSSGFSEYEMYGNYAITHHPDEFVIRKLKVCRNGTELFGVLPKPLDLFVSSFFYNYISFELWQKQKTGRLKSYLRIIKGGLPTFSL